MRPVIMNKLEVGFIDFSSSTFFTKRTDWEYHKSIGGFSISLKILNYLIDYDIYRIIILWNSKAHQISTSKFFINGYDHNDVSDKQLIVPIHHFTQIPISSINHVRTAYNVYCANVRGYSCE